MTDWWKPDADTRRALRRWDKVKPIRREVARWEVVEGLDGHDAEADDGREVRSALPSGLEAET